VVFPLFCQSVIRRAAEAVWPGAGAGGRLGRMGRQKTISDDEVLRVARDIFRAQGHTATTREIAEAAGISEAILYQRFGSKNDLFFAAMHPLKPDAEALLGPTDPPDDAHAYLRSVVVRLGRYFADVIPLALRVMTHPSLDPARLARQRIGGPAVLREGLAERLASLERRKRLRPLSAAAAARLLLSLAHDWALGGVFTPGSPTHRERELKEMVDVVWEGLRAR
jgi:AcrR family transcriptional regulator